MSISTAETQANGRFKPGASGNPAGRPRGAKNKATLLAEETMMEKVGAVVDTLVERALAGSTAAIRQFLDRTMPMPRGCSRFELPDLRGPRGIADAQEALIVAVAAGEVPPCDAERVMNLLATFRDTLQAEESKARYEDYLASQQQQAPAESVPEPAAAEAAPAIAAPDGSAPDGSAPDLAPYVTMDWPELIDAMWAAEAAEEKAARAAKAAARKAASAPAATPPAEVQAADAVDPAPDGAGGPDETPQAPVISADANQEIYREIQAGPVAPPPAAVVFDETVPPPYVDMSGQASLGGLRAARARHRDAVAGRASSYA